MIRSHTFRGAATTFSSSTVWEIIRCLSTCSRSSRKTLSACRFRSEAKKETLATCQCFNAEVCYGSGLQYCTAEASAKVKNDVEDFLLDNDLAAYFLGICQDFKHFGFAVSVLILNEDGTRIVRLLRKEACYCRFTPADKHGRISKILYANWRKSISSRSDIEEIDLLDPTSPWRDLQDKLAKSSPLGASSTKNSKVRKFAIVSRIPTVDSTYYPIPYYGALFRGKWYNIKQLIGIAKEAKLKNSAPIKYHIEVGAKYWESIFRAEGITDRRKQQARIVAEKQQILDFLTGAENSGKAWFSTFYITPDGKEQHDVVINKIDDSKEGGDWVIGLRPLCPNGQRNRHWLGRASPCFAVRRLSI